MASEIASWEPPAEPRRKPPGVPDWRPRRWLAEGRALRIRARLMFDVRYAPDSGAKADIADGPSRAMAQSRCAPARCAGARAERPVAG
jgi:hypothetical protein